MKQKSLSRYLKLIVAGMAVCGIVVCALVVPSFGRDLVASYPEFAGRYWPWLLFIWAAAIPCFVALWISWRIAERIGMDRSFTSENARSLRWIAWLAAGDAAAVFVGNAAFLLLGLSHPGVLLLSLLIVFAGIAIAVAAAVLSHLVQKAAGLQEQSDLTI